MVYKEETEEAKNKGKEEEDAKEEKGKEKEGSCSEIDGVSEK